MKYKLNKKEKDVVELEIELDAKEWESAINSAYESTKGKYEVQGFRKGKAPRKAIENAYGSMVFIDDAIDAVFREHYGNIIDKEGLYPVASPAMALDKCDETGFKMILTIQNKPSVELGEYKNIEIKGTKVKITDKEVEEYVKNIADKNARKVEVKDRAVKEGDFVTLDFSGSVDGKKFDGGTAQNYELEIGSHSFIAGFEEQMVGMQLEEERNLNVQFPADYFSKELAGKDAVFNVKVHKIVEKQVPEIDDKWASMVSEFDTLADYKKNVKETLTENKQKENDTASINKLIDEIVKKAKFEIPDCMVEDELDYILSDFERKLSMQGMKMEDYLQMMGKTIADVRKEQRDIAKTNCGIRLVIEAIIDKEDIKATDKEIDAKLEEIAKMYGQSVADIKKTVGEQELAYIRNEVLMDNFVAYLKENNKIIQ